ncbi:hypothetical protein [Sphingosinicella sp. BN140058]|uniref:hypothetical protein n=1 Tax=Sphingosinicella sp. BN140058 TaxID=1892855 RepID=UPI001012703D|nr:hypothetical protein [Sphingosinicella sp. BN140058]QAY80484.1 hypothetical protein ETR14_27995 [Sphingosinicella sp. BN140058]
MYLSDHPDLASAIKAAEEEALRYERLTGARITASQTVASDLLDLRDDPYALAAPQPSASAGATPAAVMEVRIAAPGQLEITTDLITFTCPADHELKKDGFDLL